MRIEPRWDYVEVRRAALALAREVERRQPKKATSKWWKEERHGVFVDYNQNARDRTIASGYSVRPVPDARVCCPLTWDEVPDVEPATSASTPSPTGVAKLGDPAADIDDNAGSLDQLLDLARRDEEGGLGDAPWPPHFAQAEGRAEARPAEHGRRSAQEALAQLGRPCLRAVRVAVLELLLAHLEGVGGLGRGADDQPELIGIGVVEGLAQGARARPRPRPGTRGSGASSAIRSLPVPSSST